MTNEPVAEQVVLVRSDEEIAKANADRLLWVAHAIDNVSQYIKSEKVPAFMVIVALPDGGVACMDTLDGDTFEPFAAIEEMLNSRYSPEAVNG